MAGLAALSMERLVISGHYFSTFGKYFMSKETTKHVKNSFACSLCWLLFFHPAAFACLWWPARLQSYQSIQLIIFYQHGFLIIILTISVRLKRITIFASFHFNLISIVSTCQSVDFLHFHVFLTGFMKFFEVFAEKFYGETSGKPYAIDIDTVITINGVDFDTR